MNDEQSGHVRSIKDPGYMRVVDAIADGEADEQWSSCEECGAPCQSNPEGPTLCEECDE